MIITLADQRRHAIAIIRGVFKKSSADLLNTLLDSYIEDATVEIQRDCRAYVTEYSATTTTDRAWVAAPDDLMDQMIVEGTARLKAGTGSDDWTMLDPRSWKAIVEMGGMDFSNLTTSRGALYYAIAGKNLDSSNESFRQIALYPPVTTGYANGFKCSYVPHPGSMRNVYDQTAITATFTSGDKTVTFSSAIAAQLIVDRAVGVRTSPDLPVKWYRIASVTSSTVVEMDREYAEVTAAGASFVISDCSKLEFWRPGLVQYAPARFAAYRVAEMDLGPDAAEPYRRAWELEKMRIRARVGTLYGMNDTQVLAHTRHPAIRNSY